MMRLKIIPNVFGERAASRPMFPATRSWGGGGSAAQPGLAQGGTPPGTTATAWIIVTPKSRNRRGSMAAPPSRPRYGPMRFTVACKPSGPNPRNTIGAPIRAASPPHCRHAAAGAERLMKTITSGPRGRPESLPTTPRA